MRLLTITLVRNQKRMWSRSVCVHMRHYVRELDSKMSWPFFNRERKSIVFIKQFIFPMPFPLSSADMNIIHCLAMLHMTQRWGRKGSVKLIIIKFADKQIFY